MAVKVESANMLKGLGTRLHRGSGSYSPTQQGIPTHRYAPAPPATDIQDSYQVSQNMPIVQSRWPSYGFLLLRQCYMIARTYFPAALRNSIGEDAIHLLTSRPYIAQPPSQSYL